MDGLVFCGIAVAYILVGVFFAELLEGSDTEQAMLILFWPFAIAFVALMAVLCIPIALASWIKEKW